MITKRSIDSKYKSRSEIVIYIKQEEINLPARVHYPVLKPPRTTTIRTKQDPSNHGQRIAPSEDGVATREPKSAPIPLQQPT